MQSMTAASHDLNGVELVEITGWPGKYAVYPHEDNSPGIRLLAVKRHPDEFFTFQRPSDGTLRAHSSLVGDPKLREQNPGVPLVLYLPPGQLSQISVVVKP